MRCVVLCVCALVFAGCSKDGPPEAEIPAAVEAEAPIESPETPEPTPGVAAVVHVMGVPDLDLAVVSRAQVKKAHRFNSKALKQHKKKAWNGAIEFYIQGLEQNPAHVLQRYNLGCAFAQKGDRDRALGILKQFAAEKECLPCQHRLERATTDKDYASLWEDAEFQGLTEGVSVKLPDYKTLTKKLIDELGRGYWGILKKGVDSGYGLLLGDRVIEDGSDLAKAKLAIRKGSVSGDASYLPGDMYHYTLKCRGHCCTVKSEGSEELGSPAAGILKRACYWPVSESRAWVRQLDIME